MLYKFLLDRSGNFAAISAILCVPLLLAAGLAVDFSRYSAANRHLQEVSDAAALAMAISKEQNTEKLRKIGLDYIAANADPDKVQNVQIETLSTTADDVDLTLRGDTPAMFMSLAGYDLLTSRTSALAQRATQGNVEIALVLDNTWSMSAADANGITRIAALKSAATQLINEVLQSGDGLTRIGIVPYADYVNVGMQYRNASWLDVGGDYSVPPPPRVCKWKNVTTTVCNKPLPVKTCTREVDGVIETYQCSGGCAPGHSRTVVEYKEVCTGGGKATNYKWFGCVGSRKGSDYRLHDQSPSVKYPGYLETSQRCLNPIVTLTPDKAKLLLAVNSLIINIGSYRPNTYIPAGMVWGLNVLSDTAPLDEGGAYDPQNIKPRKVAVLMTDGENTLRYRSSDGRHITLSGAGAARNNQIAQVNADTLSICDTMKAQNIEVFTVAFMVDEGAGKTMLQSCATDPAHYYDAADGDALVAAFSGIAASLRVVRLAR
ncbi:hypothetical protein RHIZO_03499 [Rhizobiaceae bacterium]|nr:hypothetical protein RHIZO_03499 [Rhizobiaceae bacterium]